ncbi:transcriptional regulator AraC family [Vibrio astriarenae]|nr:transcriptional regulator AraC family [Vibrio sp. C7]
MNQQQVSRINDVLFYIHQDIGRELSAKELADVAAYSEQHFHRIFKDVVGESIHQYIRRTRMEYAANQLMFDTKSQSSILRISVVSARYRLSAAPLKPPLICHPELGASTIYKLPKNLT